MAKRTLEHRIKLNTGGHKFDPDYMGVGGELGMQCERCGAWVALTVKASDVLPCSERPNPALEGVPMPSMCELCGGTRDLTQTFAPIQHTGDCPTGQAIRQLSASLKD